MIEASDIDKRRFKVRLNRNGAKNNDRILLLGVWKNISKRNGAAIDDGS